MALVCGSTSVTFPSTSAPSLSPHKSSNAKSSFLGFRLALSKSSIRPSVPVNSRESLQVRCLDLSIAPKDERFMFEESKANGPVKTLPSYILELAFQLINFIQILRQLDTRNRNSKPAKKGKERKAQFFKSIERKARNAKFQTLDIWNMTSYPKAADHVNTDKPWCIVDASDKILGRLASTIAIYIRGKNLAAYTPSVDMGAFAIVVIAEKVAVSGKKRTQKLYRRHSGRPGGMKVETFAQLQQRIPERIIEHAVRGMLPKGRLGRNLFTHLKVCKGPDHPHQAQKPVELPMRDKRIQKPRQTQLRCTEDEI